MIFAKHSLQIHSQPASDALTISALSGADHSSPHVPRGKEDAGRPGSEAEVSVPLARKGQGLLE